MLIAFVTCGLYLLTYDHVAAIRYVIGCIKFVICTFLVRAADVRTCAINAAIYFIAAFILFYFTSCHNLTPLDL